MFTSLQLLIFNESYIYLIFLPHPLILLFHYYIIMAGNRCGNIHSRVQVHFLILNEIAQTKGAIRFGSTNNPRRRAYEYERESYSGAMFCSPVCNMKLAENYLLRYGHRGRHNVYRRSGARQKPGFVYVIKGRKYLQPHKSFWPYPIPTFKKYLY